MFIMNNIYQYYDLIIDCCVSVCLVQYKESISVSIRLLKGLTNTLIYKTLELHFASPLALNHLTLLGLWRGH